MKEFNEHEFKSWLEDKLEYKWQIRGLTPMELVCYLGEYLNIPDVI